MIMLRRSALIFLFLTVVYSHSVVGQGFLEMPDTTEVPVFEEESMLLDLDIPPVRDRDPDPQAGPRLNIKEFRLQGLVEFPELGISRKDLIEQVESIRFDLMNEDELLESGYTIDELGQVSDLLAEIESDTKEAHVGPLEVQKLVFLIREQRRQRGVTLGMIETVADTITRYYRERGFILAKAYIPEQKVRDGVVTLTLLLGELGEVRVENRKRVSEKLIERVFASNIDEPVTSWETEENLYLVNDIPGVSVQGFFQAGSQVGDTRLLINVRDEDSWNLVARTDNHGSKKTGEYRMFVDGALLNPTGNGDELHLSALRTADPSNTYYGAISYKSIIFNPRFTGEVSVSSNDFVSRNLNEGSGSNIFFVGDSLVSSLSFQYKLKRSRIKNLSVDFGVRNVTTTLQVDTGDLGGDQGDDANIASLGFNFDVLNQNRRELYQGRFAINHAKIDEGIVTGIGEDDIDKDASTFDYSFTMLSFFKMPFTNYETRLVYKSSGQFAGSPLSNINQFSLAGPTRVRGFDVNTAQFDDALYFGADWMLNFPKFGDVEIFGEPLTRVIQPYLFLDIGYGRLVEESDGADDIKGNIAARGLGIKFNHSNFSGNLVFSEGYIDNIDNFAELPESKIYFDFQYLF